LSADIDDIAAIRRLIFRYPELIDAGDFDGVAELFRYTRMAPPPGRDERGLAAFLRELVHTYEGGTTSTKHVVNNVDVHVDPDRQHADARSYVTVFQARPGFALQPIASNRHEDTFVRIDGEWVFASRSDFPGLLGDLSHHTRQPYGDDR
jgi:hypothetical protein